jgi:O-methyltransferase involved in polyketide biosynthesis
VLTAVARALHREEPRPWVIDDYLALGLAGREGAELRERLRAELPHPFLVAFSRWMCVRARFPEDIVEQAAADGVRQYVIFGAGLDSFAYRRHDLLDRLRALRGRPPGEPAVEAAAARRARR